MIVEPDSKSNPNQDQDQDQDQHPQPQQYQPQYQTLYEVEEAIRNLSAELAEAENLPEFRRRARINQIRMRLREEIERAIDDIDIDLTTIYHKEDISPTLMKLDRIRNILAGLQHKVENFVDEYLVQQISNDMKELDEAVHDLTDERCVFGLRPPSTAVSSLASCIHRTADYLADYFQEGERIPESKKCYVSKRAEASQSENTKALKRACIEWDQLTERLNERRVYYTQDYRPLKGRIFPDRMILRVGSSEGHQTHLDLKNGVLEYYDKDVKVNDVISESLEQYAGLRCDRMGSRIKGKYRVEEGVKCTGLNKDNVVTAAKVLAFATSMDLRLKDNRIEIFGRLGGDHYIINELPKLGKLIERGSKEEIEEYYKSRLEPSSLLRVIVDYVEKNLHTLDKAKFKEMVDTIRKRREIVEERVKAMEEVENIKGRIRSYIEKDYNAVEKAISGSPT